MKKSAYILLLFFSICSCVRQQAAPSAGQPSFDTLEHGQIVYIAVPKDVPAFDDSPPYPDGRIRDDERFPGTALHTVSLMKDAFAPYVSQVIVGEGYETREQAIASAKALNARYVFVLEFDIFMRRRIMWQPRRYMFQLSVVYLDPSQEGLPYRTNIQIYSESELSYHTEQEIDTLTGPITDLAKSVFGGKS